jgi:hypothetical protein
MVIRCLNLAIVEEMTFGEEKADALVAALVSHAVLLADAGIEIGAVHERNTGTGGEGHDAGVGFDKIVVGADVRDLA